MGRLKRIVVTGGREYNDAVMVDDVLDLFGRNVEIHEGGARGADTLAARYRDSGELAGITHPAIWTREDGSVDRGAGLRRNCAMLDYVKPDIVIAFPGGNGTAHCVREARKRGIPVLRVEP